MPFSCRLHLIVQCTIALSTLTSLDLLAGPVIAPGWGAPVFREEFDGNYVDQSVWQVYNWPNDSNNEQQYYHPDQVSVSNGTLNLEAEYDPFWSNGRQYNSGAVRTWQEWSYGRFEVRAKVPWGQGFWPAIWLLPRNANWPSGGEIDIMEARGDLPYRVSSAYHWGWDANSRQYRSQAYESGANFQTGYHDFAVEWEVGTVRFYVDGVQHMTVYEPDVGIPDTPKSVILNLAVGGDYSGFPDGSTPFPSTFDVDYVRVWQRSDPLPVPQSRLLDAGFEDNDGSLDNWQTFGSTIDNIQSDWGTPLDGTRSLKMYGQFDGDANFSGAFQNIAITGGSKIDISASTLTRSEDSLVGSDNEVLMKVEFYSEAGAEYGSENFLGESILSIADGTMSEDNWESHSHQAYAPLEAVEARLTFSFQQTAANQGGSVFVDSVTFFDTLSGDFNSDGQINAADFTVWRDTLGSSVPAFSGADGDGDSLITAADLEIWQAHFGMAVANASSTAAAVPEPTGIWVILTSFLVIWTKRQRTCINMDLMTSLK